MNYQRVFVIIVASSAAAIAIAVSATFSPANAGVIANWAFETNIPPTITAPTIGPLMPDVGFGLLQGIHVNPSVWDSLDTAGPDRAFGASNWFPGPFDRYLFDLDTRGFNQVMVSWAQVSAVNGPVSFRSAYATTTGADPNAGYTTISIYTVSTTENIFSADLSVVAAASDQKHLYLELINRGTSFATGRTQIDNVLVSGTLIDPQLIPWFNPAGGTFGSGSNWFNGVAPASADRAAFNMETTYTVSLASNATNAGVVARGGTVTLNLQGRTHTISSGGIALYGDKSGDSSIYKITSSAAGGIAQYQAISLGNTSGAFGQLTLDGANTAFNATTITTGVGGTGTMIVSGGAKVVASSSSTTGSASTSVGTATITGAGSTWSQSALNSNFIVGGAGQGTLNVQSAGLASVGAFTDTIFGEQFGSIGVGAVSGTGSKLSVYRLHIGKSGQGQLTVSGGGEVSSSSISVGEASGGTGVITVSGTGSKFTVALAGSSVNIGPQGQGTFTINSGATATTFGTVAVGSDSGSGVLIVNGVNSKLTTGNLQINSHAAITVSNSGSLQTTSVGNVLLTGAVGTSITIETGGQLNTTGNTTLGGSALDLASSPIVTVSGGGSKWNSSQQLQVGADPNTKGRLAISNGGQVVTSPASSPTNSSGIVGWYAGSAGVVTIDGLGSKWTQDGGMSVGFKGSGTLNMTNYGEVDSQDGFIGRFAGSSGNVMLDENATWNMSRSFYLGGDATSAGGLAELHVGTDSYIYVGDTLQVWSGAVVDMAVDPVFPGSVFVGEGGFPAWSPGRINVGAGGTISGNGSIPSAITYSGAMISPGPGVATLQIEELSLVTGSLTKIELASASSFDKLVTRQASLGGDLQISLINGYMPLAGASFDILDWNTIFGSFATFSLPALPGGLSWNTSQLYTSGVLSVSAATIPGDFNRDGRVDGNDYLVWQAAFGMAISPAGNGADGNGNGIVDAADYVLWRHNFGAGVGTSTAAVPEPSAVLLSLVAASVIAALRSSKGHVLRGRRPVANETSNILGDA